MARCLPLSVVCLLLACGGTRSIRATSGIGITVSPANVSLQTNATQRFTATVTGTANTAVTWSGPASAQNGTIDATGLYTAPATVPSPSTIWIYVSSNADPTKKVSAAVNITAGVGINVTVSPSTATLQTNASRRFTAAVTGTTSTGVTWSVPGGAQNGTIDANGLYTAPTVVPNPATISVLATSLADSTKSASAAVTVAATVIGITVSPARVSLQTNATQRFTATVTGTANTAVTWSSPAPAQNGTTTPPVCTRHQQPCPVHQPFGSM